MRWGCCWAAVRRRIWCARARPARAWPGSSMFATMLRCGGCWNRQGSGAKMASCWWSARPWRAGERAALPARIAGKRVEELCRIDPNLEGAREQLTAAQVNLQEAAYTLRDYLSALEANPGRLDEVESRLAAIDRLKRKYGQTIAEVLE